jgi:hypothetical protein
LEQKIKHLEMVQDIVKRMASNSFFLKGWTVTLVAALLVFLVEVNDETILYVAFLPILMFWSLDGYFLRQERLFRKLYNHTCTLKNEKIDFLMDTSGFQKETASVLSVMFSITLFLFYGSMVVMIGLLVYFL